MSANSLRAANGDLSAEPVPFIDLVQQYDSISTEVLAAVRRVLSTQTFILGDEVAEFEFDAAGYCDARDAIGCASGTDALLLALMALDIGRGDEVITTPFTFFATAGAIHRVGATPVFVDIEPAGFNIDPAKVEAAVTSRTKAILPVHIFGQCAEMDTLRRIAVAHNIPIIEDACQAIGAEYKGRRAGVLGEVACFSFFPTKNLGGAGDGGLITTDDAELSKRIRRLRVHGDVGQYRHVEVGLNSRLDALQAAVLRVKLAHLDKWTEGRQRNAKHYAELFAHYNLLDAVTLPAELPERRHVYNQYCVRIANGRRDQALASLREQKIGANIYYPIPLHMQECFGYLGHKEGDLPESELAASEVLALPIFPELRVSQLETVVRGVARGLGQISDTTAPPRLHVEMKSRAA